MHDVCFHTVSDPGMVEQFRMSGELHIQIPRSVVPPTRYEDKLEGVVVALVGATSDDPGITCLLEHGGSWLSSRRGGGDVLFWGEKRRAAILAATTTDRFADVVLLSNPSKPSFWGRGLVTTWLLKLDDPSVDLSGLLEIRIAVKFASVLDVTSSTGPPPSPGD